MHILETIGAVHIASHPSKRFTVLSIRSVANFDTVAVANSDTVVDTVLDTVLDTVVDTVLDTPTPEISTKTQAKSSPKKEKKEKKEKKVGEGGEAIRRRSLRYLEIQFQDLTPEVREVLALEMIGAVASGAVDPSEVEYRIGAWASKRRSKAQEKEFTY
jgi:predicted component of type VI protein secretion system